MEPTPLDYDDLIQVRWILEVAAVKMAAERRTLEDLSELKMAQEAYINQTLNYNPGVEENMRFHLKVVAASKNAVLKSLFITIMPDLLDFFKRTKKEVDKKYFKAIQEHDRIIKHITNQNTELAEEAMKLHLKHYKGLIKRNE